jgi:hypothetical protein
MAHSKMTTMVRSAIPGAALAIALWASAPLAQTLPEQVVVKRPDGTIVAPSAASSDGNTSWWLRESSTRADERERARLDAQSGAESRVDQSRREREAARASPARNTPPTAGR